MGEMNTEPGEPAADLGLDGALGPLERGRDLGDGEAVDVPEDDCGPRSGRQLQEGRGQGPDGLPPGGPFVGRGGSSPAAASKPSATSGSSWRGGVRSLTRRRRLRARLTTMAASHGRRRRARIRSAS